MVNKDLLCLFTVIDVLNFNIFLARLAKGNVSFCHHLVPIVC